MGGRVSSVGNATARWLTRVAVLVACAIVLSMMVPASAEAQTYDGTSGTVTWSLDTDTGELHFKPTDGVEGTLASNTQNRYNFWPWYQYRSSVKSITSEGTIHATGSLYSAFSYCSSLTDVSALASWDTSRVTDMGSAFDNCSSLTDLSALASWDTSSVTSLYSAFYNCSSLTDISALASWDTSHVTDMSAAFAGCSKLTDISALASWDTSSVTSLYYTFGGCSSLTDLSALASWDTSSVTSLSYAFYGCSSLTDLSMEGWDTSKVTNVGNMFSGCRNLSSVTIGPKVTTSVIGALPTPSSRRPYTGKWVREDEAYGPYSTSELSSNWNPAMAGTWVWETVSYTVTLDANGGTGSMSALKASPDVTVPAPAFRKVGSSFVGWNTASDGSGRAYVVGATLTPTADMTLYAQWRQMPTTAEYDDGMDVTLHAGEQVTLDGLPAGAAYEVTETPVPKGWTLVRQRDATGIIVPSVG